MKILYVGPVGAKSGYGQAANDYCMALLTGGAELAIKSDQVEQLDERYDALRHCSVRSFQPDVVIIHAVPPALTAVIEGYEGLECPKVAITTWETNEMPSEIASDILERFHMVVVPSKFVRDAFKTKTRGHAEKILVVPHCFDPDWWFRDKTLAGSDVYTFYSVLTEFEQKNMMGLLTAYLTEFTAPEDKVGLWVFTPSWNQDEFKRLVQLVGNTNPPYVKFVTKRLSDHEMWTVHEGCYVTLARGEGFGLGAFEASLSGNPVIATDWSGLKEHVVPERFCRAELIPVQLTPAYIPAKMSDRLENIAGVQVRPVYRAGPLGVKADQWWAEPNLKIAKEAMRYMYENRVGKSTQYRGNLVEEFSYGAVGYRWIQALKDLLELY